MAEHIPFSIDASSEQRTYSVAEIASILKISKKSAYALCHTEPFRIVRIGKVMRISKPSFDYWLDAVQNQTKEY